MDSSNVESLAGKYTAIVVEEIRSVKRAIISELTRPEQGDMAIIHGKIVAIGNGTQVDVSIRNVHGTFWHQMDNTQVERLQPGMTVRVQSLPISKPHRTKGDRICFVAEKITILS